MGTKNICKQLVSLPILPCLANKGQALVEFTLVFILLLVVAWIPADFGLAMYTGQIAQNASRDGARIAAADPCLTGTCPGIAAQTGTCALSACYALNSNSVLHRTALRLSMALMPDTSVTLAVVPGAAGACNDQVQVTVTGTYNYFFYQVLRMVTGGSAKNSENIVRVTSMRWEHQC